MSVFLGFFLIIVFFLGSPGQRLFMLAILVEALLVGFYPPAFWVLFSATAILFLLLGHSKPQRGRSRPHVRLAGHTTNTRSRSNPRLQNTSRRRVAS